MTVLSDRLCQTWRYSGGEIGVRAKRGCPGELLARVQSSDDLLKLVMYLGSLEPNGLEDPELVFLPYMPYARQDRIATYGDPNALGIFAALLEAAGVSTVHTLDAHSDATKVAFNAANVRLVNRSPLPYLREYLEKLKLDKQIWLVAPDAGAADKVYSYGKTLDLPVFHCTKKRDPNTGALSHFEIPTLDHGVSKTDAMIVVDDICDGGRTFAGVKAAVSICYGWHFETHLFTTHGIYSNGLDALLRDFETIGSTNSFLHGLTNDRLITIDIEG